MSKVKTFPLSEYWAKQQEESKKIPGATTEIVDQLNKYISILNTIEALAKCTNIKKLKYHNTEFLQVISFHYFAHCNHLGCSVFELVKLGLCNGSSVLVRGIIESLIDMSYLWLCKRINNSSEEREAWARYSEIRKHQIDKMWRDMQENRKKKGLSVKPEIFINNERSRELELKKSEFKQIYGREHWAKISSLCDRARAVDNLQILEKRTGIVLEEVYILCYKWTSGFVHGESIASANYLIDKPEHVTINLGRDIKDLVTITAIAGICLLSFLYIYNHINHLNFDVLEQIISSGFKYEEPSVAKE